jgi:serine/threonine protein kinase
MSYKIGPYLYYKPAIGKGSFSRVYQGYNVTSKQPVAVKKISKDALKKMSISRLNKEIELIKKLDHPNIVRFFDVIQYNTDIYIIS